MVTIITTSWWFEKVRNSSGSRSSSGPTSGSRSRACTGADLRALLAGVSWRKNPGVWCFSTGFVTHFRFLRHETRAESVLKTADRVIIITTSWWLKKVRNPSGSRSSSGPTTEALPLLFWSKNSMLSFENRSCPRCIVPHVAARRSQFLSAVAARRSFGKEGKKSSGKLLKKI